MKRVFISGKIRGCPDLSHFTKAEAYLQGLGYITVNPERLLGIFGNVPDDHTAQEPNWARRFWLRESFGLLLDCEAIYFCPDMESEGMDLDRRIAKAMKLEIVT